MFKGFRKTVRRIKNNWKSDYIADCRLPLDDQLVLLEGGQGANINGNMFAMLKELQENPRWADYTAVFTVTDNTREKALARMQQYGFRRVVLAVRHSKEYCRYLATAKYLMTDNSFPPYFNKREGQVYLNTWHGTPLKTLGKANKSSLSSLGNVQKNYLMSDYALFPNEFTRDVFMNDYDLRDIFQGKSLIANYPRNSVFYDPHAGERMKQTLGLGGKRVFAYMPTWRDAATPAQKEQQLAQTRCILQGFDEKLDEDSVLLVNLHFLLAADIDCRTFSHVRYFPDTYETYEVLNACDGLITDYSSVFFDYAVTGKPVILFAYDKEEYLSTRGTYMPFEALPFPVVETVDGVVAEMQRDTKAPADFLEQFCPNGWKNSCERLFELMVTGHSDCYLPERRQQDKPLCLLYGGDLPAERFGGMKGFIQAHPEYNFLVAYRHALSQEKKEMLDDMGENVSVLGLMNVFQFTLPQLLAYGLHLAFRCTKDSKRLTRLYRREAGRLFYGIVPARTVDFSCDHPLMAGILQALPGKKQRVLHGDFCYIGKKSCRKLRYTRKLEENWGFEAVDQRAMENDLFLASDPGGLAHPSIGKASKMKQFFPLYFNRKGAMRCVSLFTLRTPVKTRLCDTVITVGSKAYAPRFLARAKHSARRHFGLYSFTVPLEDVLEMPATNTVSLVYKDGLGLDVLCPIVFCALPRNLFLGLRGPMNIHRQTDTVAVFRQSRDNRLMVYVRSVNVTDALSHRLKQAVAWVISMLWHSAKAKKLILLYEKNAAKYEESASVLFEELIDQGYTNAYFIVTKDYRFFHRIPDRYRDHIVYKYSFRHYLYFFKAKTFIGTEAIAHAIDLKTFNLPALKKVASKRLNYVFLQHGVMYMVSLNAESRQMFMRKNLKGKYRVVVSSEAEAEHFTGLGRHLAEDLYICGLPKFDRSSRNPAADKIVIMPTWRPWEINEIRTEFTETPYFKMLMRLYDGVPPELKDKVILLPHPLIVNELGKLGADVTDKIVTDARYDDILKDTALLITDYSSIAYDAFYRGANVIFYWEEKDACIQQYGPSAVLMLNEENVFGDVVYSPEQLPETVRNNYNHPQTEQQLERYRNIVAFHDGKNTKRLMELLKQDGII